MTDISEYEHITKKIKQEVRPLKCYTENKCGFARTLTVTLPHGDVLTPVYMPVGTKGAMKGITCEQMENLDCRIMLSNTYHLGTKPGSQFLGEVGGLH
jgi:queuine tRNA-ribosyltransferase catalytic subunit